ncbi:MAG: acireductone synthase [Aquificae bacterium]|nr:acireductone synthase [Aquificota bacterium]
MVKAVLVDIEGTVAPVSFVKDVLFPYSKEKMDDFIEKNWDKPYVQEVLKQVEEMEGRKLSPKELSAVLKSWIDQDRKVAPLKDIQGYIWKEGFDEGSVKSPIYEDAYRKLKEWKEKGYRLFVYSSGSVQAQKLFFSNTEKGNLLDLFDGFFDTKIGGKKDKNSYLKIAQTIGVKPEQVVFLSDNPDEVKAAAESEMVVYRVVRPEDADWIRDFPYPQISSFDEVEL